MKLLFAAIALVLGVASAATYLSYPDVRSDVPVLYWVTGSNPEREQQIAKFHQWLIRNGHGEEVALRSMDDVSRLRARHLAPPLIDAMRKADPRGATVWDGSLSQGDLPLTVRIPLFELRTDMANSDVSKMVIQGVSGVGGDICDVISGEGVRYFHSIGLLEDLTDPAKQMGFDPTKTYPALTPELTVDGRQYGFPCVMFLPEMMWINKATFAKYGVVVPPRRWTFDEFELLGKQLVAAANPLGQRRAVFFADRIEPQVMCRSLGMSRFNETMTRCTIDDPRYVEVLKLFYKWTYQDHLIPSALEEAAFATGAGYLGANPQLFNTGNYAILSWGRFALIQLRQFGDLELSVSEIPNGGFPNTIAHTRAAAIYVGGKHKDLARYFLQYLTSEPYNMQIVDSADAMPPNPAYTEIERFKHPPAHPNEWGCHEAFAEAGKNLAIGSEYSPFVLAQDDERDEKEIRERFMNDQLTAEQAAKLLADRINRRMMRTIDDDATGKLRLLYEQLTKQQKQIDGLRAAGKKIPLGLIENTFLRRYYQSKGWAE